MTQEKQTSIRILQSKPSKKHWGKHLFFYWVYWLE